METGDFVTVLLTGPVIGALGRLVVPSKQHFSIWPAMLIGIVAALLGTLVADLLGRADRPGIDWTMLVLQFAFAAVGIRLAALIHRRRG